MTALSFSSNAASSAPLSPLLTTQEAMAALRVRRTSLYALVKRGDLAQPIKIGSRSFWLASEIDDFVRTRIAAARGTLQ